MSAHSSQTDAGTSPARISSANTWQPRQSAKIDSSPAATTNSAEHHVGGGVVAEDQRRGGARGRHHRAHPLREALGRPGDRLLAPAAGAITFFAVQPSGLSVGPVSTRAQKP